MWRKAGLEMLLSSLNVYVVSWEQWHCFNHHTPMNCCHAHLSELQYCGSVTKDEPPGKWYFSLLLLNLESKADKGAVNPPDGCPVKRYLCNSACGAELDATFLLCTTALRELFSADAPFVAQEKKQRQKGDVRNECACAGSTALRAVWGGSSKTLYKTPMPVPCRFYTYFLCSYALQHQRWTKLLLLVFHKYCSGELAEFNYSYHEIAIINQMPVAAVFCSSESQKLFKNYFITSRKLL